MTISKSDIFKMAHEMAKNTVKAGDCYKTTFGACLKLLTSIVNTQYVNELLEMNKFKVVLSVLTSKAPLSSRTVSALNKTVKTKENALLKKWGASQSEKDWAIYQDCRRVMSALKHYNQ